MKTNRGYARTHPRATPHGSTVSGPRRREFRDQNPTLPSAHQTKRQGDISENLNATIRKALQEFQYWLRDSLATVRKKLPGAYQGDFGPEIQQMLLDIDATADELSWKESLPPRVENVIKAEEDSVQ
jgi:hypothetical protein